MPPAPEDSVSGRVTSTLRARRAAPISTARLRPAGHSADDVVVANTGTAPITLLVYPVDGLTGQTTGSVYANRGQPLRRAGAWVAPAVAHITVAAGAQLDVPFTVHVPASATAGDHLAGIAFEDATATVSSGSFRIRQVTREVIGVLVRVPGAAAPRLRLGSLSLQTLPGSGLAAVVVPLANTGGDLCKPKLDVSIGSRHARRAPFAPTRHGAAPRRDRLPRCAGARSSVVDVHAVCDYNLRIVDGACAHPGAHEPPLAGARRRCDREPGCEVVVQALAADGRGSCGAVGGRGRWCRRCEADPPARGKRDRAAHPLRARRNTCGFCARRGALRGVIDVGRDGRVVAADLRHLERTERDRLFRCRRLPCCRSGGTIRVTSNGGSTWLPQTSGLSRALNAIACANASSCVVVGGAGTILTTANGGSTWTVRTSESRMR